MDELPECCRPSVDASEAERAYCAYNVARGAGAFVPAWTTLPEAEQAGWTAVVEAVRETPASSRRVNGLLPEERAMLAYLSEYQGYRHVSNSLRGELLDGLEMAGWVERRATKNATKRSQMWRITSAGRDALRPNGQAVRTRVLDEERFAGEVVGRHILPNRDKEVQANLFALNLLVPPGILAGMVKEDKRDLLDDEYLCSLAARFQAPVAVVVLQLRNIGCFSAMEE